LDLVGIRGYCTLVHDEPDPGCPLEALERSLETVVAIEPAIRLEQGIVGWGQPVEMDEMGILQASSRVQGCR